MMAPGCSRRKFNCSSRGAELSLAGTSNTFNQALVVPLTTFQWRFLPSFVVKKILKINLNVSGGCQHCKGFPACQDRGEMSFQMFGEIE